MPHIDNIYIANNDLSDNNYVLANWVQIGDTLVPEGITLEIKLN